MERPIKATLRDVAATAGVSVATASRALSRPDIVSPKVKALIAKACEDLHYIPNHAARSLTMDRSNAIGVIVPTIDHPIFMPMIEGMLEVLDTSNYALFINICQRDPDREFKQTVALVQRGVEAVILGNPEHRPETSALLDRLNKPFISVAGSPRGATGNVVTFDGRHAMKLAVDHVVAAGHRQIALLSGPRATTPMIADRADGAVDALRSHGLLPPPHRIVECGFAAEDTRRGVCRLLDGGPLPTAIVCTDDQYAIMLLTECTRRGIDIPRDLSVTGCNDMFYTQFVEPRLTTVKTPFAEIGRRSAAMALSLIEGETIPSTIILDPVLILGGTVAAPRDRSR